MWRKVGLASTHSSASQPSPADYITSQLSPSYLPAMSQRPERTGQEASELVCTVSTRLAASTSPCLDRPTLLAFDAK